MSQGEKISAGAMQYITDTMLIEKLFLIDSTVGLNKQAGLADGLLGSVASSIMSWAKEHINTQDGVSGVMSSLTDIMVPGILFKINPLLGGLGTAAEVLGFSPTSIIKKMMQFLYQKLNSGSLPTLDEINNVGKSAVSAVAGSIGVQASSDMFDILHEIEKRGHLVRLVRMADWKEAKHFEDTMDKVVRPDIPFFGGSGGGKGTKGGGGIIERIFGQLFKTRATGKARWLLGGFVVWIIKTILLGAGLIAAGEKVTSLFEKSQEQEQKQEPIQKQEDGSVWAKQKLVEDNDENVAPTTTLTPTGRGKDIHVNDHKTSTWIVPMIGGSVENTLLAWAEDVYKDLVGKLPAIANTESFNKTVEEMKRGLDGSKSNQITVPSQFKSRKQIVDYALHI